VDPSIHHQLGQDALFKTWHAAPRHMIICMYSDGGSIVCGDAIYPIRRGILCFIGAGVYHYTMPDRPERYDRSKVFFEPELLEGLQQLLPEESALHGFGKDRVVCAWLPEPVLREAEVLFAQMDAAPSTALETTASTMRLLGMIHRYAQKQIPEPSGAMDRAVGYINANLPTDLTIDAVCAAAHVSKYHFCRQFKRHTGLTVMEYILKSRIMQAENLLLKEKLSVTEISARCGFGSVSYFCRVFKAETGKSPLTYRKTGGAAE